MASIWIIIMIMSMIRQIISYPRAIPLGIMFRHDEEDALSGSYMAMTKHNQNNTRVLFMLSEESEKIQHDPKNILQTIKLTCQLLRNGFFFLLANGDFDAHEAYASISKELNMPFINWALSYDPAPFEVSIYPPVEQAIADVLISKSWTDYVYLYASDDAMIIACMAISRAFSGFIRSIEMDKYVQSKRHRPSRIIARPLPDPTESEDLPDFLSQLPSQTGRNRIIIDANGQKLRNIIQALTEEARNMTNTHFIIASYELEESELEAFKSGFINVTMLNILHNGNHLLRDLKSAWGKPLTLQSAIAYDSVSVAVETLNRVLKEKPDAFRVNFRHGQFYNAKGQYKGLWCDVTKDKENPHRSGPDKFEHGRRISRHLKQIQHYGVTGHIQFDEKGHRKNYIIEINDVEFHTIWKHGIGLVTDQSRTSYKRTSDPGDLVKKKFIITTALNAPFVMYKKDFDTSNDTKQQFEGFCIELMKYLSQKIDNFDYEIRLASDGQFGAPQKDGTWNGMIGELLSGKADMAVASLTITNLRETAVDFSKPFLTTGLSIMIKRPEAQEMSVFSFMHPLSMEVWMYIIFAYLGISVVIFLVSRFSPYEWRVEETSQGTFTISNDFSVYNCLWFTLAAFMQQGIDILPRSVSGRIASSAWWFFTMIIVSSYTANLAAFLTLEKMNAPIETVEDLAKQTKIKYGVQKGGSSAAFFQNSSVQVYKRMWDNMEAQVPEVFVSNYAEGFERVRKSGGRYAFILEETASDYTNNQKPCDTIKVGQNLNAVGYGVATPFGSHLQSRINLAILELQETGEINRLHDKWWVQKNEGQCPQGPQDTGNSLTQNKVAGIFYILIGGMIVSLMAAFVEFLYRSRLEAQKSHDPLRSSQLDMSTKGEESMHIAHYAKTRAPQFSGMIKIQSDSSEFPW